MTIFTYVGPQTGGAALDNVRTSTVFAGTGANTLTLNSTHDIILATTTGGAGNIQLPNPALAVNLNHFWTVVDTGGVFEATPITLLRFAAEQIRGVAASYELRTNFGMWTFWNDGVNWWFIA